MQQIISVIIKVSPRDYMHNSMPLVVGHKSPQCSVELSERHTSRVHSLMTRLRLTKQGRALSGVIHTPSERPRLSICQKPLSSRPHLSQHSLIVCRSRKDHSELFTDHCGRWSSFPLVSANVNHCHLVFTMTRAAISRLWLGTLLTFGGLMQHVELWCFWDATINTPSLSDV